MGGGVSGGERTERRVAASVTRTAIVKGEAATSGATTAASPGAAQPAMARQLNGTCVEWESGEVGAQGEVGPSAVARCWAIPAVTSGPDPGE